MEVTEARLMSMHKSKKTSNFNLEGRFISFAAEEGYKLKFLRLSTATGEYQIKIPKELRSSLYRTLVPGMWIQVSGYQKLNSEKGTVKLQAHSVTPAAPGLKQSRLAANPAEASTPSPVASPQAVNSPKSKANILVCQKSDCCKRGGRALMEALRVSLDDRDDLAGQVSIKATGCMKHCKAGPNLIMPDKTRYSHIGAEAVPALLEKHFPAPAEVTESTVSS
jgi:(2Fe-2S) ferredoxin